MLPLLYALPISNAAKECLALSQAVKREAQRLRSRLTSVRQQVSWASTTRVMRAADPQALILAQLPWFDQRIAGALLMVLLAFVTELTLANIWYWAAGYERNARTPCQPSKTSVCQPLSANAPPRLIVDNTRQAASSSVAGDEFEQVLLESFDFNADNDIQASKAYAHYVTACSRLGLNPKSNNWFAAQLLSIGVKRTTRNGRRFYVGLAPIEQMSSKAA